MVLRAGAGTGDPRRLALVDTVGGVTGRELPWTDGRSTILGVDPDRALMFVRMTQDGHESCWAIDIKRKALEAASAYLSRIRADPLQRGRGSSLMLVTTLALAGLAVAMFVVGVARDAL